MSSLKLATTLALILATSASAAEPPPPAASVVPAAAKPPATAAKEKLICVTEQVVGSRLPKRVCRTAAQAEARRDAAERTGQIIKDMGGPGPTGADGEPKLP
jgi:hypothetical protein